VKRGERTLVRSGLVFHVGAEYLQVGAEYLQGLVAAGDQAAGRAPAHRAAEMSPQLLAMVAAEQAGRDGNCSPRPKASRLGATQQQVAWSGSPLNSPSSQPQASRRTKGGAQFVEHRGKGEVMELST